VGRRGLFAELARQQRQNQQAQAAAVRRAAAAEREAERRLRAAAREAQQAARADTRAQVEAERARKLAYTEARVAQTEVRTVSVQARSEGLAQLLAWTLNRDDHVAFESLKKRASHPPFDAKGLDAKLRLPAPPPADVQASHQRDGQARANRLQELRAVYERECSSRNRVVAGHNAQVDAFSEAFSRGDPEAIVEYYTLVLTRSAYPDGFPQQFRVAYVPESAQLVVEYELPTIVVVPTVAEYRYVKTRDEQTEKARPQKEVRSQYASVVAQVALRTVHELFEADRGKALGTVIFNGIVRTTDPSTGKQVQPCLVSLRATRDAFSELDLAHVSHVDVAVCGSGTSRYATG
jgi:restriction system protein